VQLQKNFVLEESEKINQNGCYNSKR
jgi:hypothetical protein